MVSSRVPPLCAIGYHGEGWERARRYRMVDGETTNLMICLLWMVDLCAREHGRLITCPEISVLPPVRTHYDHPGRCREVAAVRIHAPCHGLAYFWNSSFRLPYPCLTFFLGFSRFRLEFWVGEQHCYFFAPHRVRLQNTVSYSHGWWFCQQRRQKASYEEMMSKRDEFNQVCYIKSNAQTITLETWWSSGFRSCHKQLS